MATKTATVSQPEAPEARDEGPDAPLLDTLGAELKKLVQKGKERGYVTYDDLNAALPADQVSSEQIEDTMAMLSEAGINVVENEEGEVAIAKRIEAGREMMIGGICESPLTMRAIIAWRDALNDGKMLLRDVIDLDATYGNSAFEAQSAGLADGAEAEAESEGEGEEIAAAEASEE